MMQEYRTKELYADFYENEGKPLVVIIGGSRPGLPAPLNKDFLERLKKDFQVLLLAYFAPVIFRRVLSACRWNTL